MRGISLCLIPSIHFCAASCFVLLNSPHSLWLPVQPLAHWRVALQAEEPMVIQEGMYLLQSCTLLSAAPQAASGDMAIKTLQASPAQSRSRGWSAARLRYPGFFKCEAGSDTSHEITPPGIYTEISSPKEKVPFSPGTWLSQPGKAGAWASWTHSKGGSQVLLALTKRLTAPRISLLFPAGSLTAPLHPTPVWLRHSQVSHWDSHAKSCWAERSPELSKSWGGKHSS